MSNPNSSIVKVSFICNICRNKSITYTKRPDIKKEICEDCVRKDKLERGKEWRKNRKLSLAQATL